MIDKNIIEKALAKEHNISDEKQDPGNRLWEIVQIIVYIMILIIQIGIKMKIQIKKKYNKISVKERRNDTCCVLLWCKYVISIYDMI